LLYILLSSFGLVAQGSFPSENGLFTVNYLKGCEFTQIEVKPNGSTGTPFICFDADLSDIGSNNNCFGSPAQTAEDFRFTYEEPGVYDILFLRQLSNSQVYDSISIEILAPSTPFIALTSCNEELVLDVNPEEEGYDFYTVDFGDGSAAQEYSNNDFPFSYQYADPTQEFTMSVEGSFDNTGNNNCNNAVFTETFIPEDQSEQAASINRVEILSEERFVIEYELNVNQSYQLQLKQNQNGNYQSVATFSGSEGGTYAFQNRDLNANFYCVRIVSVSVCSGQELLSNEVCTIRFSGSSQLDGNFLDWNHANFQTTELLKNGEVIYSGSAPYLDENVLCGQVDEYQVISVDSEGVEVVSLPKELATATGSPAIPIDQIATNVLSNTELELSWELPGGLQPDRYIVYKKRDLEEDFFRVDTTNTNTYIVEGTAFNERIDYFSVAYLNKCGGISPVRVIAPNILLTLSQKESDIALNWNTYTGFGAQLQNYVIKKYDDNMSLLVENNVDTAVSYHDNIAQSDEQLFFYQIEAHSENGLVAYSNLVRYKRPSSFFVPTGFTPNGDGKNEKIKVLGKFIEDIEFSIYNRWGTLIFRTKVKEEGWDGYLKNRPAPEGTYSYTVRVKDKYGEEYYKSGVFNLIR